MKPLLILGLIALGLLGHSVRAGNEGGAGGDGVLLGNDLYLIDLVEAGVETDPYLDTSLQQDPVFNNVVERLRPGLAPLKSEAAVSGVALKLVELSKFSTPLALTLLQSIESYRWLLVNHALVDVKDEDSVLEIGAGALTQLAIRRLHTIFVSNKTWQQLAPGHQAALILHETTYAIVKPIKHGMGAGKNEWSYQSSPKAREFVGALFSQDKSHLCGLIDGVGSLTTDQCKLGPEKYYERADKTNKRGPQWYPQPILVLKTVSKTKDRLFSDVGVYEHFDPLSTTAPQQICKAALSAAASSTPDPIDGLLNMSISLFVKHERRHTARWNGFTNSHGELSIFRDWTMFDIDEWLGDPLVLELHQAPWDEPKCENAVAKRIREIETLSGGVPNVFWKPLAEEGKP